MSESTTPIDVAAIRAGQLVSGRFTSGGTFTDLLVIRKSGRLDAYLSDLHHIIIVRNTGLLGSCIAEVTAVRDPRPAWADDPTAILIDRYGPGGWRTARWART